MTPSPEQQAFYLIAECEQRIIIIFRDCERKSQKGDIFLRLMYHSSNELALQYMQWQRQIEGVGPSKTPV